MTLLRRVEKESVATAMSGGVGASPTTMRDALTAKVERVSLNRRTAGGCAYPSNPSVATFGAATFTFTTRQAAFYMGCGLNRTTLRRGPSRPRPSQPN
jgi:hypothetical protein